MADRLAEIDAASRRRRLVARRLEGTSLIEPDGTRLVNFGGNDYLGVIADARLGPAAEVSSGATASALVCGWSVEHERLAQAIAKLEGTEAAVVFPSGYAACSGAIACLCQAGDLILSDALNHASLIDGCRASRATRVIVGHRDSTEFERHLKQRRGEHRRVWIVTDSVFSMDGDIAPIQELVELAARYDAYVLVDEAHATGVLGDRGGGACEWLGVADRVPIRIGTLSKAIGHHGGFVAGPQVVIDYLVQFCRSLIFSTALPPVIARGAAEVIERLPAMGDRREHLRAMSQRLRQQLGRFMAAGSRDNPTPIVPVVIGDEATAVAASQRLRRSGFFVPAIRPPTVPPGTSRLRISLSAAHSTTQIDHLADAIKQLPRF